MPGKWKKVIHDQTVTWLANWTENVNGQHKYVFLAAGSSLKGQSDMQKFEKARELKVRPCQSFCVRLSSLITNKRNTSTVYVKTTTVTLEARLWQTDKELQPCISSTSLPSEQVTRKAQKRQTLLAVAPYDANTLHLNHPISLSSISLVKIRYASIRGLRSIHKFSRIFGYSKTTRKTRMTCLIA